MIFITKSGIEFPPTKDWKFKVGFWIYFLAEFLIRAVMVTVSS